MESVEVNFHNSTEVAPACQLMQKKLAYIWFIQIIAQFGLVLKVQVLYFSNTKHKHSLGATMCHCTYFQMDPWNHSKSLEI